MVDLMVSNRHLMVQIIKVVAIIKAMLTAAMVITIG